MVTERDMLNALAKRYTNIRQGTLSDKWVRAEHVRLRLGYSRRQRIADFISADKHPGAPYGSALAFYGHEVKVSRADWLREIAEPEKAEAFSRYMHYWYLVVPDAAIVKPGELPAGWGLMVLRANGLRVSVSAPRRTPEPMPSDLVISLMSSVARTAYRDPLHRDAPVAHVKTWDDRCGFCGDFGPCGLHQPRAAASLGSNPRRA